MGTTQLTPEFSEFLQLLNDRKLPYLVIGGFAVIAHGYVRATKDLELWIPKDPNVAATLCDIIEEFFGVRPPAEPFLVAGKIFRMGNYPNAIEIFNQIPGVEFTACRSRSLMIELDGVKISLISLADLRTNKVTVGRPSDLGDLDNLPPAGD